jgi:hypothetical protein
VVTYCVLIFGWIQLQNKTLELDRLQFAGEMIRRIIRVRELSDKLRKIFLQVRFVSLRSRGALTGLDRLSFGSGISDVR